MTGYLKSPLTSEMPLRHVQDILVDTVDNDCLKRNALLWRNNESDGVYNHQRFDCLLNRVFRRRSKKTSKLRVTGLCDAWCIPLTKGQ